MDAEFPVGPLVGTTASPLDPQLQPLADNGGPTETRALYSLSPAVDAAMPVGGDPPFDQRGFTREVGSAPDIGAYETGNLAGYSAWAGETIPPGLDATFTGDSEGDRNQNGIEYACGLIPTTLENNSILTAVLMPDGLGGTEMHLTFPYEPDAPDLKYTLGRNTDLLGFNDRYRYFSDSGTEQFHPSGKVSSILDPSGKTITVIDKATSTAHGHWQLEVEERP